MTAAQSIFSDRSHYRRGQRMELADILRPYWKDAPFRDEQRRNMYGVSSEDFRVVDKLEEAGIAVLPMTWNYYLKRGEMAQALAFIQSARRAGRPILSYVGGDEGVAVPSGCEDVYVVRASGFKSRQRERQVAQPVFFEDPARTHGDLTTHDRPANAPERPLVGFCGQASARVLKSAWDVSRGWVRNTAHGLGARLEEPQPLYPPGLLRAQAMRALEKSPLVETRFIVRSRYRAGNASAERTSREFYENMAGADYTLCLRGGGNFSKRFYETLAMARIPALVDTDCLLPFEPILPWDAIIVRAPAAQLDSLPQRIADHFTSAGLAGLAGRKRQCRKIWEDWLSFAGFHRQLAQWICRKSS
jgi:hypothetical protein